MSGPGRHDGIASGPWSHDESIGSFAARPRQLARRPSETSKTLWSKEMTNGTARGTHHALVEVVHRRAHFQGGSNG
jgi:hypothetical protein